MNSLKKLSKHIFRLLKVEDIVIPIGRTSKGNLGIRFNQNNDDFDIMLDSIPLPTDSVYEHENNIELKKMFEKYLFETPLGTETYKVASATPVEDEVSHAKVETKKTIKPNK